MEVRHLYPCKGVIIATVATGTRRTKTKLYIAQGNMGTLLGCRSAEILGLVGFAPQVYEARKRTSNDMSPAMPQRNTQQLHPKLHWGITPGVIIRQTQDTRVR